MKWISRGGAVVLGLAVAAGLVTSLTGCASGAGSDSSSGSTSDSEGSFVELAEERLGALAGVESVLIFQNPRDPDADPAELDGLDASLWRVGLTVTMTATATAEEIEAAARAERAFSEDSAVDGEWTAGLDAGRETTRPEDDVSPRRAVSLQIFPVADRALADLLDGALRISQSPGVDTVASARGRTSVTAVDAAALAIAYNGISTEPLFETGGEFLTSDGRVQLTVVPGQVSPAVIRAIIGQAAAYPTADVALVSPLDGPSAPSVFVNGVTAAEATAILAALGDPGLASELLAPFTIPITIRSGSGDVGGFVGGVDPASP